MLCDVVAHRWNHLASGEVRFVISLCHCQSHDVLASIKTCYVQRLEGYPESRLCINRLLRTDLRKQCYHDFQHKYDSIRCVFFKAYQNV